VHLEDLVLHDADKDVRSSTHELTRAHAVLRARRRSDELGITPRAAQNLVAELGLHEVTGRGS
jgi:hypothetical protein